MVEVLVPESEDTFDESATLEKAIEFGIEQQALYINAAHIDALVLSCKVVDLDMQEVKRLKKLDIEHRKYGCDDSKCGVKGCL
jgi:hypothetical protein